jgi:hypothetical protein
MSESRLGGIKTRMRDILVDFASSLNDKAKQSANHSKDIAMLTEVSDFINLNLQNLNDDDVYVFNQTLYPKLFKILKKYNDATNNADLGSIEQLKNLRDVINSTQYEKVKITPGDMHRYKENGLYTRYTDGVEYYDLDLYRLGKITQISYNRVGSDWNQTMNIHFEKKIDDETTFDQIISEQTIFYKKKPIADATIADATIADAIIADKIDHTSNNDKNLPTAIEIHGGRKTRSQKSRKDRRTKRVRKRTNKLTQNVGNVKHSRKKLK